MRSMAMLYWGAVFLVYGQFALAQNVDYVSSALWFEINDLKASGNYAYCAFLHGLIVLDITDPAVPIVYGRELLPGHGYGIDVDGNYAYVADGVSGLQIVEIGNPANPAFVGGCQTPGDAVGIFVYGNYAYLACGDSGIQIVNIMDKMNPAPVAGLDTPGSALRIFVAGDFAYVADGDSGLQIIDVSDPSSPAPAGSYQSQYEANDVCISGDYAYLGTGGCNPGCWGDMEVIDISDPNAPVLVGPIGMNEWVPRLFALNNYLFICHFGSGVGGVIILDISDPTNPILLNDYSYISTDLPSALSAAGDNALVAWNRRVSIGWVFAWDAQYIETIDIADLYNPFHTGTYLVPHRARSVYLSGSYAFVADGKAGLQIVDISDPTAPSVAGYFETGGFAQYVFVSGSYAYVVSYYCGSLDCNEWCDIVDISQISNPTRASSFSYACTENNYWYGDVIVSGNYAYIICSSEYLQIWDISDPDNPFLVIGFLIPDYSYGIYKLDDYLYISSSQAGLIIYNVSNPGIPFFVGECDTPGQGRDVFCIGDYAYVADGDSGLQVIDVSQPNNPHITGNFATPDTTRSVFVSGNYAYLADWRSGLQVVDVSNPGNPVFAGSYDTPDLGLDVVVSGDYAYLTDFYSLMILRFNPQTGIEDIGSLPRALTLNQNYPNPFNTSTRIDLDIPTAGNIDFSVYDVLGRRVATLFEGQKKPGHYSLVWDAGNVPSGIYFAKLKTGSRSESIRMTLLK